MDANRGFMAKQMDIDVFTRHVLDCIRRELKEQGRIVLAEINKHGNGNVEIRIREGKESYFLMTNWGELRALKKKNPYAVDRMLLQKLEEAGLKIEERDSQYLQTVLQVS
ncbi:hypothetical protein [Salirhabdus salicampi]|uniref:hypothetical protein n=1 Tax=Salirhabdus salicampi TaxID=476102 RepID=UPI0020C4E683|nr:hypothetical protein [Salirhabdus salicampi]MCP8615978.1 hypothetical protein [Salirhabdus salicampi]